jgi:hypothetical protein
MGTGEALHTTQHPCKGRGIDIKAEKAPSR